MFRAVWFVVRLVGSLALLVLLLALFCVGLIAAGAVEKWHDKDSESGRSGSPDEK